MTFTCHRSSGEVTFYEARLSEFRYGHEPKFTDISKKPSEDIISEETYIKNVPDINATELAAEYNAELQCEYPPPIPRFDKTFMVMNLFSLSKDLVVDTDKKYFIKKKTVGVTKVIFENFKIDFDYAVTKTLKFYKKRRDFFRKICLLATFDFSYVK